MFIRKLVKQNKSKEPLTEKLVTEIQIKKNKAKLMKIKKIRKKRKLSQAM